MSSRFFRISNPGALGLLALAVAVGSCGDATVSDPRVTDPNVFAAKLVSVTGTSLTGPANRPLGPVTFRVTDIGGSPVAGATVRFEVRTGGGSITPSSAISATDGSVSATWTLGATIGAQTVMATLANQLPLDSVRVTANATAGPAYRLRWVRGGAAGTQMQNDTTGATSKDTMEVQLYDSTGGQITGVGGVTVTWGTSAPATVDGQPVNSTAVTDVNGKARTVWMFRDPIGAAIPPSAIAKRMVATVASVGQVEFQAHVYPGKAALITLTLGNASPTVGTTTAVNATVKDINGFLIGGANVVFSSATGVLSPSSATTGTDGIAKVNWTLGSGAGIQTVSAVSSVPATPYTVISTVSSNLTVTPAPPILTIAAGDGQSVTAGYTLPVPIKVKVTDSNGAAISGVTVNFEVTGGGGGFPSATTATAVSDASGFASISWTTGVTAGANTLQASAGGGTPVTFRATGAAPVLAKVSADPGVQVALTPVAITVRVTDSGGLPLAGRTVSFVVTAGGGSVAPASAVSDALGNATVTWTMGAAASGANTLSASLAGGAPVVFTANVP